MEQQREMPLFGSVREIKPAPMDLVKRCRTEKQAIQLCIQLSGLSYEAVGDALDIDKGHMSRIMNGRGNFPDNKRIALMSLCGNKAPRQYESYMLGEDESEEERELRELREQEQQARRRREELEQKISAA